MILISMDGHSAIACRESQLLLMHALHTLITAFHGTSLNVRLTDVFARSKVFRGLSWLARGLSPWKVGVAHHLPHSLCAHIVRLIRLHVLPGFNIHTSKVVIVHCCRCIVLQLHDRLHCVVGATFFWRRKSNIVVDGILAELHVLLDVTRLLTLKLGSLQSPQIREAWKDRVDAVELVADSIGAELLRLAKCEECK